jgi:putative membrane protein
MGRVLGSSDWITQLGMSLYAQCPGPFGGFGHMGYYGYGGHFMGLLIIILLIVVIYLVLKNDRTKKIEGGSADTPLDILKKRYAQGEITKEQFEAMKQDLKS